MIDGVVRMMGAPDDFTGPVNLGNPEEFTILELAETIIALTGASSKIIFEPLPQDDPLQRKPNIDLALKRLKWKPQIQLQAGLKRAIKYFKTLQ